MLSVCLSRFLETKLSDKLIASFLLSIAQAQSMSSSPSCSKVCVGDKGPKSSCVNTPLQMTTPHFIFILMILVGSCSRSSSIMAVAKSVTLYGRASQLVVGFQSTRSQPISVPDPLRSFLSASKQAIPLRTYDFSRVPASQFRVVIH